MATRKQEHVLEERQQAILRSVIREHILTGEPIGSRKIATGKRLDLSPATIRNIMAELEERGLLTQPHTSAGRVPTAAAYRLYVDRMIRRATMAPAQAQEIERALEASQGEITDLLGAASHQLSRFSRHVGVVLVPEVQRIVIEHFEFVRIDPRRVVAILVGRSGVVHNRILEIAETIDQPGLDQVGRYLTDEFGGRTVPEIREMLRQQVLVERATYDRLVARGIELGQQTLEAETAEGADVIVDGAANLLESPEFADPEKLRSLMQALEEKQSLIALLGRVLEDEGVQVVIGEEPSSAGLAGCSLVAASYGASDRAMGTLGIVGPARMEYAQAIALVDHLAQVLRCLPDERRRETFRFSRRFRWGRRGGDHRGRRNRRRRRAVRGFPVRGS